MLFIACSLTYNLRIEFETIKVVILREKYVKKLSKALKKLHDNDDNIGIAFPHLIPYYLNHSLLYLGVDMGVIGLIDCLRSITIETIEVIKTWQESQVTYPEVKDFIWVLEHLLLNPYSLTLTDFLN